MGQGKLEAEPPSREHLTGPGWSIPAGREHCALGDGFAHFRNGDINDRFLGLLLGFLRALLGKALRQNTGLTTFMPARVALVNGDPVVNLVGWQGSGDLVGVAAANCFLVVHPEQTELAEGDWVDVLPKEQ